MLMRAALVLCGLVLLTGASSDHPRPAGSPKSGQKQAQPAKSTQGTESDQRGTEKLPLVVKVVDPKPTHQHTEQKPEEVREAPKEDRTLEIVSIIATGAATIVIAVFTTLLYCSTRGLWIEAKKAGDTAVTALASLASAERAYVKLSYERPGVVLQSSIGTVELKIKNWGKTPATVTNVRFGAALLPHGESLSIEFPYKGPVSSDIASAFLVPDEFYTASLPFPLHGTDERTIRDSGKKLWVFGHVDYIDVFRCRHRSGWVRTYIPSLQGTDDNLVYAVGDRYNYDRPRKKGEGNDWDEEPKV
ncbi:MAG: hypothetical protein ABI671_18200 [Burkholderiales bacterium]